MNVEALFFAQLRDITGVRQEAIALSEGARVTDLVALLTTKYGQAFRDAIDQTEGMRILVSDREYDVPDGMEAPLREGDSIVFLPPIHGG